MELQDVKTYSELVEFITNDLASESVRGISDKIGINHGSFYKLKAGIQPGDRVRRKLNHFLQNKYGVSLEEKGLHIHIVKKQNLNVQGNFYDVQGTSENFTRKDSNQVSFLVQELIEAKTELKRVKAELETIKKKK